MKLYLFVQDAIRLIIILISANKNIRKFIQINVYIMNKVLISIKELYIYKNINTYSSYLTNKESLQQVYNLPSEISDIEDLAKDINDNLPEETLSLSETNEDSHLVHTKNNPKFIDNIPQVLREPILIL